MILCTSSIQAMRLCDNMLFRLSIGVGSFSKHGVLAEKMGSNSAERRSSDTDWGTDRHVAAVLKLAYSGATSLLTWFSPSRAVLTLYRCGLLVLHISCGLFPAFDNFVAAS